MASFDVVELLLPDDFHHHLRDGDVLSEIVKHAARSFGRLIAMPNIKPPVRTLEEAQAYHARIMAHADPATFQALMTLYLTDATTRDDIVRAHASGLVHACKLYPAGATTNSEFGVTDIIKVKPALAAMAEVGLPLLVHGEVVDTAVDVFDREKVSGMALATTYLYSTFFFAVKFFREALVRSFGAVLYSTFPPLSDTHLVLPQVFIDLVLRPLLRTLLIYLDLVPFLLQP